MSCIPGRVRHRYKRNRCRHCKKTKKEIKQEKERMKIRRNLPRYKKCPHCGKRLLNQVHCSSCGLPLHPTIIEGVITYPISADAKRQT